MLYYEQVILASKPQTSSISPSESTTTRSSVSSLLSDKTQDDFPSELLSTMINNVIFSMPSVLLSKPMYFHSRPKGIECIREISNEFSLCEKTFHLSVLLLDRIFMKINTYDEIKRIAAFCLILSTKFTDDEPNKAKLIEAKYSKILSLNYKSDEVFMLKLLDYNLHCTTAYDILNYLISQGVFNGENYDRNAVNYLNKLIQKNFILKLNPLQVAYSIVEIFRRKNKRWENSDDIIKLYQLGEFKKSLEFGFMVFSEALYKKKNKKFKSQKMEGLNHLK